MAAYRAGEPWHLTGEAEEKAREEQAERQEDDPWMAQVSAYVSDKGEVACKELLGVLGFLPREMGRKDSMRVAGLLKRLGFVRRRTFTSGKWKDLARFVRNTP